MYKRQIFNLLFIGLGLTLACDDDNGLGVSDGGLGDTLVLADTTGEKSADGALPPLNLSKGDDGAKDMSTALASAEVRAGKVTATTQLLSGINVEGKIGDFKIYNDKVAFIIQAARVSDGWNPYGGEVIDAARVDSTKGTSLLGETILAVGTNIMSPISVGVVKDGSDGKEALVRAIGLPKVVPYLAAMMGDNFGGFVDAYLVVDYALKPGTEALEIRCRFLSYSQFNQSLPLLIVGLAAGDGAELFGEGMGFAISATQELDYVGMLGKDVAYAFVSPEKKFTPLISYSGVWVHSNKVDGTLAPQGELSRTFHLVVTRGETEAMRKAVRAILKQTGLTAVSGTVKDAVGTAVAGARVHVQKDDTSKTYVTMARTDDKGAYQMELAAGSYWMTVVADGRAPASAVKATVSTTALSQDLTVGGTGTIKVTVTDDKGTALPSKIVFTPSKSPTAVSSAFGEETWPHGAALIAFSTDGSATAALPPETYTVHVSRGFEYEVAKQTVTLADGKTESVALSIKRSVDTTGYQSGDFHLHSMASQDSSDLYDFKVATLVASGIELPVATDHEYISDYNPYIAKAGVQKWMTGVIGEELTTLVYGHFNPFPLTQDPTKANMGAYVWFKQTAPQMFAGVRKLWPQAVMQVNHPRSPSIGGYYSFVGYDSSAGTFKRKDDWSTNFDAFEVFNSDSFTTTKDTVLDFYSFLDRGFLVTGTGNSDSHKARNSEVGWPRNYVALSTDDPAQVSLTEFAKNIKAQKVLMTGGPFVTVAVGSKGMGEVADATSKKVSLKIKVQAPTWMAPTQLYVIMGGTTVSTITLDSSTASTTNPVVRYDNQVELLPTADTWVVVAVTGSAALAPVTRGTPFALTNPIYLDVNGNSAYDAPKAW